MQETEHPGLFQVFADQVTYNNAKITLKDLLYCIQTTGLIEGGTVEDVRKIISTIVQFS